METFCLFTSKSNRHIRDEPEPEVSGFDTNTYIDNHLAALAGSDLCEQLQDEGFGHVPGQVPHIPANAGHRTTGFVKQEVAWKQRLA